ncbi:MAG: arginine--tRNA ligase [Acidimicrobiales bacterium]
MLRDQLVGALRDALVALDVQPLPAVINLERPARREHGDWSTNVALASAKKAGRNPRELAQAIADRLNNDLPPHVLKVDIAGGGFVNFHLAHTWLHDVLRDVIDTGVADFGRHGFGAGQRVNVEFVSSNPTGPIHAGHARGAIFGDSLARLLERCGYDVTREFYLNDRGVQMQSYAASLLARKNNEELPEGGYAGTYIQLWAGEMPDDVDSLEWGYARALRDQREVLESARIKFDVWSSERELVGAGAVEAALAELRERDMVYEEDGAVWLRSTTFGDDKDRVLVKSDGQYTYLAPDIAYHRDKYQRDYSLLIDIWGADHHGYIRRMKAAMQALGHDPTELEVLITQLVKLMSNGIEVKISKRTGDIVEMRDVIEEIGTDATRFTYLLQSIDTQQTFDLELAKSESMDNPVFYVQMAHARACNITRFAADRGAIRGPLADADPSLLVHDRELDILRGLSEFAETIASACNDRAPHRITAWLRELAAAFHGFYHDCYVVGDGVAPELTQARLWLTEAARIGLHAGLDVIGVAAPETM